MRVPSLTAEQTKVLDEIGERMSIMADRLHDSISMVLGAFIYEHRGMPSHGMHRHEETDETTRFNLVHDGHLGHLTPEAWLRSQQEFMRWHHKMGDTKPQDTEIVITKSGHVVIVKRPEAWQSSN